MALETEAIEAFLAREWGAERVRVTQAGMMSGGAIQENWKLDIDVDGKVLRTVLRTDAPSSLDVSHGRAEEYALFNAAHAAGTTVPKPLVLGRNVEGMERSFFLMERVDGEASPRRLVGSDRAGDGLVRQLGAELARIHSIRDENTDLDFLDLPEGAPALVRVAEFRAALDASPAPQPVIEWGARWLELNAPPAPGEMVLCHNDYRTGNYMVGKQGLTGILDWEFAGWGDRHADLGWFCAKCWRFNRPDLEAGGIGTREAFYEGYEEVAGSVVDREAVAYWEVLAAVRWAVIATRQGDRHLSGKERSLELALTRHVVPTLEIDILDQTGGFDA
jgi:aminoglycoside phosphotransferase (APT) family kinase protein